MADPVRIASGQIALAAAQICWAGLLVYLPPHLLHAAGPDAWLSLILGSLAGVAVLLSLAGLFRRYPRTDIYACAEALAGPWPGKAAGLLLICSSLMTASIDLRTVADFFVGIALPMTPIIVVMTLLIGLAAWAVRLGPEVICRINAVSFLVCALIVLSLPLSLRGKMDAGSLRPFLEDGPGPVLKGAYVAAGGLAGVVELGVLIPLGDDLRKAARQALFGMGLGIFTLLYLLVVVLLVFGPEIGGYLFKPVDAMVTMMSLGEYAERVDMLMIAIWQPAVTLRMAFSLYAAAVGVGRVFGLKDRRPAVYPLAVSVMLLALWSWPSNSEVLHFIRVTWPLCSVMVGLGVPALLLLLAALRGKRAHSQRIRADSAGR